MRRLRYLAAMFVAAAAMVSACDSVAPEDRLIYQKPHPAKRAVLLVDFTGQRCVNCPNGARIIQQMEERYGDTTLIAVGMYSGPFGRSVRGTLYPLTTEQGDSYFNQWNLSGQPVSVIDYVETSELYTSWPEIVDKRIDMPAPLRLSLSEAKAEDDKLSVSLYAYGTDGNTDGRLQLWLLEDSIVGYQVRHEPLDDLNTQINDMEYVHRHVFRKAVNDPQGDPFTIGETQEKTLTFTTDILPEWEVRHLSVVAFVYNDNGVQQACRVAVAP